MRHPIFFAPTLTATESYFEDEIIRKSSNLLPGSRFSNSDHSFSEEGCERTAKMYDDHWSSHRWTFNKSRTRVKRSDGGQNMNNGISMQSINFAQCVN